MKSYGGEHVTAGSIIIRQLGTVIHPGRNVGMGKDYTIFAMFDGTVQFQRLGRDRKQVHILADGYAPTEQVRKAVPATSKSIPAEIAAKAMAAVKTAAASVSAAVSAPKAEKAPKAPKADAGEKPEKAPKKPKA